MALIALASLSHGHPPTPQHRAEVEEKRKILAALAHRLGRLFGRWADFACSKAERLREGTALAMARRMRSDTERGWRAWKEYVATRLHFRRAGRIRMLQVWVSRLLVPRKRERLATEWHCE